MYQVSSSIQVSTKFKIYTNYNDFLSLQINEMELQMSYFVYNIYSRYIGSGKIIHSIARYSWRISNENEYYLFASSGGQPQ